MNKKESLWDLAVKKNLQSNTSNTGEKTLLLVGSKGAGKSTIIQRFLDRNEPAKETLALEYNFARKSGRSLTKETCHIWELGGGTLFINLLDLHLGKDNTTLILVLDLSKPEKLWNVMESFLVYVHKFYKKIENLCDKMLESSTNLDEEKKKFPISLVIIGGKYDLFQEFETEKKKRICQILRCVALSLSASLVFYSDKEANLVKKLKDVFHYHGFDGPQWKGYCTDFNKPLLISSGCDTFEAIGMGKTEQYTKAHGLPLDSFKHIYTMYFPQTPDSESVKNLPDDPAKNVNFKEPLIDSLRAQKDEELDRFIMENEQRKKLTSTTL